MMNEDFNNTHEFHFEGLGDYPDYDDYKAIDEEEIRKIAREEAIKTPKGWGKFFLGLFLALLTVGVLWWKTNVFQKKVAVHDTVSVPKQSLTLSEGEITTERAVAEKVIPGIVGISTKERVDTLYGSGLAEGVGSGVIVHKDGYILTNAHVVANGKAESITVRLSNGENLQGKLLWTDQSLDLAIVKIEKEGLTTVALGDSDSVHVGDKAIAIGNPLGLDLQSTLTSGYISGLNRTVYVQKGVMTGLIQADAAINKGNSGGALLNAKGELIGINTIKNLAGEGIGFAIPVNIAKTVIEQITTQRKFKSVYLGIYGVDVAYYTQVTGQQLAQKSGIIVTEIEPESAADKSKLQREDILIAMDGQVLEGMNSLKKELLKHKIGDKVKLTLIRGKDKIEKEIILQERTGESQ